MENAKEPGTLPLKITGKVETLEYTVVLTNGKSIKVIADDYYIDSTEEGDPRHYVMVRRKKMVCQFDASDVKAVLSSDAVDVDSAVIALNTPRRKPSKKKPV
jgi:hypothetical protein